MTVYKYNLEKCTFIGTFIYLRLLFCVFPHDIFIFAYIPELWTLSTKQFIDNICNKKQKTDYRRSIIRHNSPFYLRVKDNCFNSNISFLLHRSSNYLQVRMRNPTKRCFMKMSGVERLVLTARKGS